MSDFNIKDFEEVYREFSLKERLLSLKYDMRPRIDIIRGYAAILDQIAENNEENLPEKTQQYTENITQAGDELLAILNAITKHLE